MAVFTHAIGIWCVILQDDNFDAMTFGRRSDCDICLRVEPADEPANAEASKRISGQHFAHEIGGGTYALTDTSTNGTAVDGRQLGRGEAVELTGAAEVDVAGVLRLRFTPRVVGGAVQWIVDRESGGKSQPAIYVMRDLHPFFDSKTGQALAIRKLKDTLRALLSTLSSVVLLSGPNLTIPDELAKEIVIIDFPPPDFEELRAFFAAQIEKVRGRSKVEVDVDDDALDALARAAQGLTMGEAELAFGKALTMDMRLDASDVAVIQEEKKQIVRKTGILTVERPLDMAEVGGLEVLKTWLDRRKDIFGEEARRHGIPAPKGVLLTGVPGCGKSLCARAMADHWKLPILRLDMGAVFGGLVGDSERNMRGAIATAKAMSPCILMIDEIEKGLAGSSGGGGDGGTATRVFGTLLTWMSDKTEPVFVVATANEFDRLPPEMLRKGRFDELFFVDFPNAVERRSILKIHLRKAIERRVPRPQAAEVDEVVASFDLDEQHEVTRADKSGRRGRASGSLVDLSRDYTGSELEEAVKTAVINAFSDGRRPFAAADVAVGIAQTIPPIDTMAEKIEALRAKARECTVLASRPDEPVPAGGGPKSSGHRPGFGRAADPAAAGGGRRPLPVAARAVRGRGRGAGRRAVPAARRWRWAGRFGRRPVRFAVVLP